MIASTREQASSTVNLTAELARSCRRIAATMRHQEAEQQLLNSVEHALKCDFIAYFGLAKPLESVAFYFSRGKFERAEEHFSLANLIRRIVEDARHELNTRPLRLQLEDGDIGPLFPAVDSKLLSQGVVLTLPSVDKGTVHVLFVAFRHAVADTAPMFEFLNALMSIVDLAKQKVATGQRYKSEHERVVKANQEWQCSVDVLTQLLCLVSPTGRIVRTNKALEQLGLGRVAQVRGRYVWELLARLGGSGANDPLAYGATDARHSWSTHWQAAIEYGNTAWDIYNQVNERYYRIAINLIDLSRPTSRPTSKRAEEHAVVIVEDITLTRADPLPVTDARSELLRDIELKSNELKAVNRQLKSLSNELINTQEEERKRVALELHDGVGQVLTMMKLRLDCILEDTQPPFSGDTLSRIKALREDLRNCIADVHRIGMNLRPPMLDDLGIGATLSWFFREYTKTTPDIDVSVKIKLDECSLDASLKTEIFRITQEAMNNVAKHAKASHVQYRLESRDDRIFLMIKDDGVGFDTCKRGIDGAGFKNMQERVSRNGGQFAVWSAPGAGVKISAAWPC